MKRIAPVLTCIFIALAPSLALAQIQGGVQQSGNVTANDLAVWKGPGQIEDGGAVPAAGVSSVGNASSDSSITIGGTGSGPYTGAITVKCTVATSSQIGCVIPDGTIITDTAGTITVAKATTSAFGVIEVGTGLTATAGVITPTFGTATNQVAEGGVITAGGPTGSATVAPIITYNAAGQLTTVSSATITPAIGSVTGPGTGVIAALGVATGSSGAFLLSTNNLSDITSASSARSNLGLGTSATVNTGTSGATIPLLNSNPTASGGWTFAGVETNFGANGGNGGLVIINGSTSGNYFFEASSAGAPIVDGIPSSTSALANMCYNTGTGAWTYDSSGACTVSSLRFKHDVHQLVGNLDVISKINPIKFVYNNQSSIKGEQEGVSAESVANADPTLVEFDKEGKPLKVKYIELIGRLIGAVKEQQHEIVALQRALRSESR